MERVDANNWMEQWADRHAVRLESMRPCRPGERRVGLARVIEAGQVLRLEALEELLPMAGQLTFEEFGPPPASGGPGPNGSAAGGDDGNPPLDNMEGRVTKRGPEEVFRGFEVGEGLFAAVDQFTLVGKGFERRDRMLAVLQKYLGPGQAGLFGLSTYRESWRFECGASVNWSEGREDWCAIITGRTLQLVGESKHLEFILDVDGFRDHCTRVDPRLDDYSRQLVDLQSMQRALEAGNFVGLRKCQVLKSGKLAGGKLVQDGASLVFGTRDGVRLLAYDKGLQSKGRICSNRLEAGYFKEKAEHAWIKIVNGARLGLDHFTRAVGELVCGCIDFRERGNHKHIARMERLSWWSAIVDRLGSVRIRVAQAVSTLNSSCASMTRQYLKKLARAVVVAEAKGHDLLLDLVQRVQDLRDGQELEDRDVTPLELAFEPLRAFRVAT